MKRGGGLRLVANRTVVDEIKDCIVMAHSYAVCSASADPKNAEKWSNLRSAWCADELETALELLESVTVVERGPQGAA